MVNQFPVAEVPINSESVINTLETKPQEFALLNGSLMVYFEAAGKKEDGLLKQP